MIQPSQILKGAVILLFACASGCSSLAPTPTVRDHLLAVPNVIVALPQASTITETKRAEDFVVYKVKYHNHWIAGLYFGGNPDYKARVSRGGAVVVESRLPGYMSTAVWKQGRIVELEIVGKLDESPMHVEYVHGWTIGMARSDLSAAVQILLSVRTEKDAGTEDK